MAVLGFVVLASGLDLYTDLSHGATASHITKEAVIVVLAAAFIVWIWLGQRRQVAELVQLKQELADRHNFERMSEDVQKLRRQLSDVVSKQFDDWHLTESEKAVGWLLLKGLSLKEIAIIRETLEKTVRQQASSLYKKAGLNGRHAFSAWFIEDLL
jgi:DNA-binding CsgD family transcriptional regulator